MDNNTNQDIVVEDYTRYAIMESMEELQKIQKHDVTQMMLESEFLQTCYETKMVDVMEATKDDLFAGLIVSTQRFFEKITGFFRNKSIQSFKKQFNDNSIKLIRSNIEAIKKDCLKLDTQKLTPYWDGNYKTDPAEFGKMMGTVTANINGGKYTDYSFATKFISNTKMVEDQDTNLSGYLKNYFRYGDNNLDSPKSITMTGKEFVGKLDDIISFVEKYPTEISGYPGKMSDSYNKNFRRLKLPDGKTVNLAEAEREADKEENGTPATNEKPTETKQESNTTESVTITPNTYFSVEGKYACETMLPLYFGYPITEGENDNKDKDGEVNPNKQKDGSAATDVSSVDKDINGNPNEDKKADTTATAKSYFEDCNHFFKLALAAYQTATEERFVVYCKLLKLVAGQYMKVPKEQVQKANEKVKNEKKRLFGKKKKK